MHAFAQVFVGGHAFAFLASDAFASLDSDVLAVFGPWMKRQRDEDPGVASPSDEAVSAFARLAELCRRSTERSDALPAHDVEGSVMAEPTLPDAEEPHSVMVQPKVEEVHEIPIGPRTVITPWDDPRTAARSSIDAVACAVPPNSPSGDESTKTLASPTKREPLDSPCRPRSPDSFESVSPTGYAEPVGIAEPALPSASSSCVSSSSTQLPVLSTVSPEEWNNEEMLEVEHEMAMELGLTWRARGPPGPKAGGPQKWRNAPWVEGKDGGYSGWKKRGGKNRKHFANKYGPGGSHHGDERRPKPPPKNPPPQR